MRKTIKMTETTQLAKTIAGEITLAEDWPIALKKWRQLFEVNQKQLSEKLEINQSVLSDYEGGRRKSPGIKFIKKIVDSLIEIDVNRGGETIKKLTPPTPHNAITDIHEFKTPVTVKKIVDTAKAKIMTKNKTKNQTVKGYTIIDSIQAIQSLSSEDFTKIYGATTERALVFTKVRYGRSPMIALKVTKPKPTMVLLHGPTPKQVDKLAVKIAELENIQLAVSNIKDEDTLIQNLRELTT